MTDTTTTEPANEPGTEEEKKERRSLAQQTAKIDNEIMNLYESITKLEDERDVITDRIEVLRETMERLEAIKI